MEHAATASTGETAPRHVPADPVGAVIAVAVERCPAEPLFERLHLRGIDVVPYSRQLVAQFAADLRNRRTSQTLVKDRAYTALRLDHDAVQALLPAARERLDRGRLHPSAQAALWALIWARTPAADLPDMIPRLHEQAGTALLGDITQEILGQRSDVRAFGAAYLDHACASIAGGQLHDLRIALACRSDSPAVRYLSLHQLTEPPATNQDIVRWCSWSEDVGLADERFVGWALGLRHRSSHPEVIAALDTAIGRLTARLGESHVS
jgi:hypothetical protein